MSDEIIEGQIVPAKIDALAINRAPDIVLDEAKKAAQALTKVIEDKPKKVTFNGKTYLQFEDWQTLGRFYGVTAVVRSTKYTEFGSDDDKVLGFESQADALLVATNQVISSAEAMCLNDEPNWSRKPLFQLKSMAQTRACAKALRNVLAWVVVLAGYAPTPAEEMDDVDGGIKTPQRKSEKATPKTDSSLITEPQRKRLFAIAKGKGIDNDKLRQMIGNHGFEHTNEITKAAYETICAEIEG